MEKFKKLLGYLGILAGALLIVYAIIYLAGLNIETNQVEQFSTDVLSVTGEITAIDSSGVTIRDFTEESVVLVFDDETVLEKMEPVNKFLREIEVKDVKVDDLAGVIYQLENGNNVVDKLSIYPPFLVYGKINTIGENSFDIESEIGDYSVIIDENTEIIRIMEAGNVMYGLDLSELKVDEQVDVVSTYDADRNSNSFTAASINIINY